MLRRTLDILAAAGHHVWPMPTTGPGSASGIAQDCVRKGADLILAAGGDGTINEVMNGMVGTAVPLGILPGGTANVLAMELGLGRHMEKAARLVSQFVPERIAAGLLRGGGINPRYFLLMAGVGLDAHIVYNLNLQLKSRLGKLSYWLTGMGQLGKTLEEFEARAEERSIRCGFALASRVSNYAGDLRIARGASLLDDQFEVVLFEGESVTHYLKYFAGVLAQSLERMKGVTILHTRRCDFSAAANSRVYVQIDGEYAGRLPASVEIVPDALSLLVPPSYPARRRAGTGNRETKVPS